MDLEANGLSAGEDKALTDRLRNELVRLEKYQVIERALMDDILREQGFGQSGCTSNECLVTVGRLIGVNISKVGNDYTVSARNTGSSPRQIGFRAYIYDDELSF